MQLSVLSIEYIFLARAGMAIFVVHGWLGARFDTRVHHVWPTWSTAGVHGGTLTRRSHMSVSPLRPMMDTRCYKAFLVVSAILRLL